MTELKKLFKGGLRPRTGYRSGGDPLKRWKTNIMNLATRHQTEAKSGRQAQRKSWHELQSDGSYLATIRLNHCLVEIAGENCWAMADLNEVVKFYDVVIAKLKTSAFDQDIINTALTIKSMKQEALSVLKTRFPDSPELKETREATNHPPVAEQPQQTATNQEVQS